ncbi:MAG TPA: type VI secretion system membrane subunit TssM [Planctomycetota bacterium]
MLKKLLTIVTRPPVPFVLGTLFAVLLVWFGGNLLHTAYGWPGTATIVLLCVLIVASAATFAVLRRVRARQKARAIEAEIRNQARSQAATLPPGRSSEIDALQARFDEALASLKASKLGRGALYAMPWFIIIGPPGSGKTTAITESGLNFPFMKGPNQKRGIRGLGGTRNCDWWFTDQSILLDTAGRYTTEAEDRDEWLAFLGMIKKARKLKPINGVLIALSITDVLNADEEGLERHATTIRQRIDELVKQLEIVFPVYLMFTKCDLLDGFVEFFSAMSKEQRAQVWGATFDHRAPAGTEMHTRFAEEFDLLCQRADDERRRLLVPDRPAAQQQKIFSLTLQLRAAKRKLTEFVRLLTQPNPYSDASELRGVYLTSGTQEGAPIDHVLQKLSSAFGLQAKSEGQAPAVVDAKSYFIRDLFTKVIYADRELAHSSAAIQRRRELVRKGVIIGSAAAAVVLAATSVMAWSDTRSLLADFDSARREQVAMDPDRMEAPTAEAQQKLGRLRDRYLAIQAAYSPASLLGPGLDVVRAAMSDYAKHLRNTFLIPCVRHLEKELNKYVAATDNKADYATINQLVLVYEAMNSLEFTETAELEKAIQERDLWRWSPAEIGTRGISLATSEEARHLEAYAKARELHPRTWVVGNDQNLLGEARKKLSSGPAFQNVVRQILESDDSARKSSEQDLSKTVTKKVEELAGTTTPIPEEQRKVMISAARRLLVIKQMAAIGLHDTSSLQKVIDSLTDLDSAQSAPQKEFRDNLEVLRLAEAAPRPGLGADVVQDAYTAALKAIASLRDNLDSLVRGRTEVGVLLPDVIAGRQDWVAEFRQKWKAAQQTVERQLEVVDKELKARTDAQSERVSQPIRASLDSMFESIAEALAREARSEMQRHWHATVGPAIASMTERFPCNPNATEEVAPAAFAELLKPGGTIDQELKVLENLRAITELRTRLELSDTFDAFVARIRALQTACFDPAAPAMPRLQFKIAKMNISPPVLDAILTIAQGDAVSKQQGTTEKIRSVVRKWEIGKSGAQLVLETSVDLPNNQRLKLSVPESRPSASPWGLLRVLAAGKSEKASGDAKVTWEVGYRRNDGTEATTGCWLQFEPVGLQNPFHPGFFLLEPASKIFQDGS